MILLLQTVIRTVILYYVIIFAIRLMGKRQIGDLQPSELVITILISEIAAIPIQDLDIPLIYGILATLTLVLLEMFTSFLAMKSLGLRKLFYGRSAIIIKDGIIDQKMLRKLRVTVPDLMEVLRNQEVFDMSQVAYAILETNGQMSVLLKTDYQTANVNDIKGIHEESSMPCLIVSDGKLMHEAIKSCKISKEEIRKRLDKCGIELKNVFLMTCDENGKVNIVEKEQTK